MLECHDFLQTYHECRTQDSIGKSPAHDRQIQLGYMDVAVYGEIEAKQIAKQGHYAHNQQPDVIIFPDVHPPQRKKATGNNSYQCQPVQLDAHHLLVMHDFLVEDFFQHSFRSQERLDQRYQNKQREQMAVSPHLWFIKGMTDGEHTPKAYG